MINPEAPFLLRSVAAKNFRDQHLFVMQAPTNTIAVPLFPMVSIRKTGYSHPKAAKVTRRSRPPRSWCRLSTAQCEQ